MGKTTTLIRAMSLGELASKYGTTTKTLNKRLSRRGVSFGKDRLLLAVQVKQAIDALGHWEINLDDE